MESLLLKPLEFAAPLLMLLLMYSAVTPKAVHGGVEYWLTG